MDDSKNPTASEAPAAPAPRGERGERPQRGNGQRRGRFSGPRPPRACPFCTQKVDYIDFKAIDLLRRYVTDRGKIKARRKVGTCAKHQRRVAIAIKRARNVALLPFSTENARD